MPHRWLSQTKSSMLESTEGGVGFDNHVSARALRREARSSSSATPPWSRCHRSFLVWSTTVETECERVLLNGGCRLRKSQQRSQRDIDTAGSPEVCQARRLRLLRPSPCRGGRSTHPSDHRIEPRHSSVCASDTVLNRVAVTVAVKAALKDGTVIRTYDM